MSNSERITTRVFDAVRAFGDHTSPDVVLTSEQLSRRDQFDEFCAVLDGIFDYRLLTDGAPRAPFRGAWWQLGSGFAFEIHYSGLLFESILHRTRGLSQDYCLLLLPRSGLVDGIIDGERLRMEPGNLYLLDMSRAQMGRSEDMHQVSIFLPFDVFGYDPRRHAPVMSLPLETPEGILLSNALEALLAAASIADPASQTRLTEGFGQLTHTLLLGGRGDDGLASVEVTRAAALRSYLEDNCLDLELTAARLGNAVGASRATVYRVFEPDGGVDAAIRKRRLKHAARDLSLTAPRRGVVREVAERYGFDDVNQFSRSFRRELGYAASEVVGLVHDQSAPLNQETSSHTPIRRENTVSRLFK
ncbi:MAG: helix-turn-helix domain-containing protein [Pseudomonadota bacterium]